MSDDQLDLLLQKPVARGRGSLPSFEAMEEINVSGKRKTNLRKVLRAVREHPGFHYLALEKVTGLDRHEVMRRLCDLEGDRVKGLPRLVERGPKVPNPNNGRRTLTTWWPARPK